MGLGGLYCLLLQTRVLDVKRPGTYESIERADRKKA
jgi:hypothetical protein